MAQQVVVIEPDYFSVSVTAPQTVTISNTGPQGAKGDTGATGPQGIQGPTGATGAPGVVQTVSGTSPITATGTTAITVGINQGSITIAESQVTNLVTDLAAKAPLASPALTGTPTSTTAALTTSTTQIATTAFVDQNTGDIRQFAADKSVLQNIPARIHPAEQLLKQAVFWIDSNHSSAANQTVSNLGWGGSVLDATAGSTGSADSNDPKFLSWDGTNYVYLPGVANNSLSVPDAANLDITGDIDVRVQVAADDWTPSANQQLISKWEADGPTNSWYLRLNTDGKLTLAWAPTNGTSAAATSSVATGVTDGSVKWIRATLDVDNGASANDVKFWTSDDGTTWTQLGTTVTQSGTTQIYAGTGRVIVGSIRGDVEMLAGKVFRAQVLNGINGTPVLDVDTSLITSGSNTSFTALTGQTVSINRSTSGRKSVAVVHPCWLLGTDDYFKVLDNDLLDFGATDSFTFGMVIREWTAQTNYGLLLSKEVLSSGGYGLYSSGTGPNITAFATDGTNTISVTSTNGAFTSTAVVIAVINRSDNTLKIYLNGTAVSVSAAILGSAANSSNFHVGHRSYGAAYVDMENTAVFAVRRALTAAEITTLTNYYQGQAA